MMGNALHRKRVFVVCFCIIAFATPAFAQDDALRKFFKENNRLVLVNPYPRSLPIGTIMRHDGGELQEVDLDCFLPHQSEAVPEEAYDFIPKNTEKMRGITAAFLKHIGRVEVGSSEKVSIQVVEGKRVVMPESRFSKIIQDRSFPENCLHMLSEKQNYLVYEVVTGRLYFTFWKKVNGKWQINRIPFGAPEQGTVKQNEAAASTAADETNQLSALWMSTKEGGIEMKESRVLAVHARHWNPGSPGTLGNPMPFFQFRRLWNLDWKFTRPHN